MQHARIDDDVALRRRDQVAVADASAFPHAGRPQDRLFLPLAGFDQSGQLGVRHDALLFLADQSNVSSTLAAWPGLAAVSKASMKSEKAKRWLIIISGST